MSPAHGHSQDSDRIASRITLTVGAVVFALCALLLHRLVFQGWAHSYDSAIYTRSLWGLARGELYNPMVDLHVLSIHGNFVLYLLAPLTRVLHPATVLVLAQAAALGVTAGILVREWLWELRARSDDAWSLVAAGSFVGFAFAACSPMVSNPVLFDVRPDFIGVPLLAWGLCRAHRRGAFDARGVLVMLLSLLVREEYMMVVVGALALAPMSPLRQWSLRLGGIVLAVAYWAFYWFGFRNWIGDGSYEIAQQVGSAFLDSSTLTWAQIAGYKLEILFVFAASVGGSVLLGWRWLGAAVPGMLLLLVTSRMQEQVLNFHYVQFVVPGLVVASVDGFRRWLRQAEGRASHLPLVAAVLMTASFLVSSALPEGGRYRAESFLLGAGLGANLEVQIERVAAAHRLVGYVPEGVGVALPHELAAPLADRAMIRPSITYFAMLAEDGQAPEGIDWVAAPGRDWSVGGRTLVDAHGFRLIEIQPPRLALLTRQAEVSPGESIGLAPVRDCERPLGVWSSVGLALCGVERGADGQLGLRMARVAQGTAPAASVVVFVSDQGGRPEPALAWHGLLNAAHLPLGTQFYFVTSAPLRGEGRFDVEVVLTQPNASGGMVPLVPQPASEGRVGVRVTGAW